MNIIYLIGGVPRAGKSQFSKRLAKELGITGIDFDDITTVFEKVVPDYGLFMTMDQTLREQKAEPVVRSLIELYLYRQESLIIEGDNFDLDYFKEYLELTKGNLKMPVFGYADISKEDKIRINTETTKDMNCWFEPLENDQKLKIAQEMIDRSKELKRKVEGINNPNLKYFETHNNFAEALDQALEFCLN
jgi:hypothetical protein